MYLQSMFYFPSTIVWLDDDPGFLKVVSGPFKEKYLTKCFHSPKDCLTFFETYTPPLSKIPFLKGSVKNEYYDTLDHTPVDFNVLSISQLRQYEKRFQEISVLIIDLNMPEFDGTEVLKKLRHLPMKKILLTNETDHQLAVEAFNDNLIDRFIQKNSPTLTEELKKYVETLNQQYFCDYSLPILAHLETEKKIPLSDPIWIDFFEHWCQENQIKEYYLIDKIGSFLCVNHKNEQCCFVLQTDETLENFVQDYQEEGNVEPFIQAIQAREKIPFFGFGKEAWQFEGKQWEQHFYPCQTLQGRELYYWAMIK